MKTLKESLLGDLDTKMNISNKDLVVTCLYSYDYKQRFNGITALKEMIESHKVKPIRQLSKLKDVNGYIVEFSHMAQDDIDYNFMQFTHKTGEKCCTVRICGVDTNIHCSWLYTDWKYIKKEYDVKNGLVYIVPDELIELFDNIYKSRERH